jgi:hypothetical protein
MNFRRQRLWVAVVGIIILGFGISRRLQPGLSEGQKWPIEGHLDMEKLLQTKPMRSPFSVIK